MTNELIILDKAQQALAEAKTIPELKAARDAATGAKAWVKSRGLGIESENEAAEYIVRAERRIGAELIRMAETGERNTGGLPLGAETKPLEDLSDNGRWERQRAQAKARTLVADGDQTQKTLASLGITKSDSQRWQLLARLPEDLFERILAHNKAARDRIAKVDFYRAAKNPTQDEAPETPIAKGFDMFRAGVYHMVGWRVDDAGVGGPTKNDLLTYPVDDLKQIAELLQVMVAAYQQAKAARS
jgi:hypothetical protein